MAEKNFILIAVDSSNVERVIGAGRSAGLPQWRDEQFHASNPAIPLNDRKDRFVTVLAIYPTVSRPELAIVEIRDSAVLTRQGVPLIRVLGHVVEIHGDYGTTTGARESVPVKPFWEVRVDGRTIGALDGKLDDLQELGREAIKLATSYITRIIAENSHKFEESED